ncbi:uncharacterized protein LOC123563437 [Mercenaria mercenaria]|uniref:uncharacterized protein LOC123563437 n=1 Tax=Mercenaria mercenaria TaxID=6596 RepID=UPI00234F7033|nr:uncharacterized protein LOC123563437 [Mercenaria mercenaria]
MVPCFNFTQLYIHSSYRSYSTIRRKPEFQTKTPQLGGLALSVYETQMSSQQSGGGYTGTGTKADLDNHGNQCNPNNPNHQGYSSAYSGTGTKADLGNHSNQMNPNNPSYQAPKK